jgi:hypothetical protein
MVHAVFEQWIGLLRLQPQAAVALLGDGGWPATA